jgi:dolichol-phosphate mannosyltransferase
LDLYQYFSSQIPFMTQSEKSIPAVSVVIPTLNEAENIHPLLTRIFETAQASQLSLEVVIVDDSSTDGTREQVRGWQLTHPVTMVCRETKDGLASAVIEGARIARGAIVVVMDADLSHPPEALPELIRPIAADTCDMVIGSRYIEGGSTPDWPLSRKMASRLATVPARILTDPYDPLAGFFAVRRNQLADLDESVSGFKIGLEVLVSGEGRLRVTEVPITFYDRFKGKSKMNKRIISDYFRQLLTLIGVRPAVSFATGLGTALSIGGALDFLVFFLLYHQGVAIGSAHIGSFVAASIPTAIIHRRWTFPVNDRRWHHTGGFLLISLLVLALRGGILGGVLQLGCPLFPAMMVTIAASFTATALGLTCFVFAGTGGKPGADVRGRLICLGVVLFSFALRLFYLGQPALLEEEAYYWNYAHHLAIGYLDHPPMVAILIRTGTLLFGNTEFGVRVSALICWLVTAGFSYSLTRSLYGRAAAFRAVLLLSVLPVFFSAGMIMTPDAPLIACWSGTLLFLYRALLLEKPKAWFGVGICLGLGMFSKYTIVLLGPAIVLFMLIDPKSRKWLLKSGPYLAVLVALILFSPVIVWNYEHNWASFVFQGERRVSGLSQFSTHILVGQILLMLTPAGVLGLLAFLQHGRSLPPGFLTQDSQEKRSYLLFLLLILAPSLVFFFFSLTKEVQLNWTGPLWLAVIPFLAVTMDGDGTALIRWCRRLWPATIVALLLLYGFCLHFYSLGLPGIPALERPFLTGWNSVAGTVNSIVEQEKGKTGTRPLVVGMDKYRIASGLAFYRYKDAVSVRDKKPDYTVHETLSRHIFDLPGLMYAYWFPPAVLDGKDLLLVASSRDMVDERFLSQYVKDMGEIRELDIKKDGLIIDHCFLRLVRGYHHR